jgi:recombination protein RecR
MIPDEIKRFVELFSRLPSIGPRQATRLAFRLVSKGSQGIQLLAHALFQLSKLKLCNECFFVHSNEGLLCSICSDPKRNTGTYMVVEKETDLMSIEKTGSYAGRYLVLGELTRSGALEEEQKKRLEALKTTIQEKNPGKCEEIILALNPTTYGDITASVIQKELAPFAKKITRLGRGIPTGGEIEFADEETLNHSLLRRE